MSASQWLLSSYIKWVKHCNISTGFLLGTNNSKKLIYVNETNLKLINVTLRKITSILSSVEK